MNNKLLKIISGAQTGVDRGALDAAMDSNVQCGGWCPEGRKAEDGVIPDKYPVQVLKGGGYTQRTRQNVLDSDGTVIIYFAYLSGGTEQTLRFCLDAKKTYLLIDAHEIDVNRAAQRMAEFFIGLEGETLNFAGPRGSGNIHAYEYTVKAVSKFIETIK